MEWASGLTVTTTGLDKHDKDAIRQDVEAAGGRYSPNLSKRTTHLVTPEVVSNVTEKLAAAAAAAGPGQQRFKALQVVSKCWVSASAGMRRKADEAQFAPLLPPATGVTSLPGPAQACDRGSVSAQRAALAAPAAPAGPQTPWVVHFSQLPDESVYGPGACEQQHASPSAVQQLAHQLHLRLSPISEAYSQEHSTGHSDATAGAQGWQHSGLGTPDPARSRQSAAVPLMHAGAGLKGNSPLAFSAAACARHMPDYPPPQQLFSNATDIAEPHSTVKAGNAAGLTSTAAAAVPAETPTAAGRTCGDLDIGSSKGRARPPALQLPSADNSRGAGASIGWGLTAPTMQQQQQQQQSWLPQSVQEQPGATSTPPRALKRVGTQGYSSLDPADTAAADLADKQRRATAEQGQEVRHPVGHLLQQAVGMPLLQQQQPSAHYKWQERASCAGGAVAAGGSSSSSVADLIAALEHVTDSSRRGTADLAHATNAGAVDAARIGAISSGGALPPGAQHAACLTSADAGGLPSVEGSGGAGADSGSSIDGLLQSLRRLTGDRTALAPAAAEPALEQPAAPAARGAAAQSPLVATQHRLQAGSGWHLPEVGSCLDAAQPPPQRRPEPFYWGSGGGCSSSAATVHGSTTVTGGGAAPGTVGPSPLDLEQLLGMLHRATGDSRRGTNESRRTTTEAAGSYRPSSSGGRMGPEQTASAGAQAVADAAAVALPLSQEAVQSFGGAGAGTSPQSGWYRPVAAADTVSPLLQFTAQPAQQQQQQASTGGQSSVAELIAALRRATGESRRSTAEFMPAAAPALDNDVVAGEYDTPGAGARDASRPRKPHMTLKLPSEDYSIDRGCNNINQAAEGGSNTNSSSNSQGSYGATSSNGSSHGLASSTVDGSSTQEPDTDSVAGLLSALKCIAAASKLQEAAALAPELAAAAEAQVAVLESHADALPPGNEYAQLVSRLSLELSELNKQGLRQQQQQQQAQEGAHGVQQAWAADMTARGGVSGERPVAADNLSSGSQGLQQLVEALQRMGPAAPVAPAAVSTPTVPQPGAQPGLQLSPGQWTRPLQQLPQYVAAQQVGQMRPEQVQAVECMQTTARHLEQQQQQLSLSLSLSLSPHQGRAPAYVALEHAGPQGSPAVTAAAGHSLDALLSALQATSSRPQGDPQATGTAGSSSEVALAVEGAAEHADQTSAGGNGLQGLVAALMNSASRPVNQPQGFGDFSQGQAASPAPAVQSVGGVGGVAANMAAAAQHSIGSSVEQLLQQLSAAAAQQTPQKAGGPAGVPEAVLGMWQPAAAGPMSGPVAGLHVSAHDLATVRGAARSVQPSDGITAAAAPVQSAGTEPDVDAGVLGVAALQLEQQQVVQHHQQHHDLSSASAAAAGSAGVPPGPEGLPSLPCTHDIQAAAAGPRVLLQQQTPAQGELQVTTAPCLADMVVVFDRSVAAEARHKASEVLAACGATVMPGVPHLGCRANTIVAEAEAAASCLPLLLDIVTPAWVTRVGKALKQQQQEDGPSGQQEGASRGFRCPPGGHLVRFSPDIARAVSLQLQHVLQPATGGSLRHHLDAGRGAQDECTGELQTCHESAGVMASHGQAAGSDASSPVAAAGCEAAGATGSNSHQWGGSHSNGSSSSVASGPQEQQQQALPVLVVPQGYLATSAGGSMPVLLHEAQPLQHLQQMMPAAMLTDQLWSVGQHPSIVAQEELEAAVLPGSLNTNLTLLMPQSSSSLLGHASVCCAVGDTAKGLTCGDVLTAIYNFYQQEVLLQAAGLQEGSMEGSPGCPSQGQDSTQAEGVDAAGESRCLQQGELAELERGDVDLVGTQQQPVGSTQGSGVRLIKRLQLLGHKQMFEGLLRVTRDPCSAVYEVCLA